MTLESAFASYTRPRVDALAHTDGEDPRRIAASVYAESPDLVPTGFRHMLQKNPDQIGFKVVTRNTNSSEPVSTLDVLFSFNSDADKPASIPVRHDSDGWRCGKVSELTVERLIALIDPLTGERRYEPAGSDPLLNFRRD